jgi:polyphenol oxidase
MELSTSAVSNSQTPNSDWQWQNWEGLPYLTCSLLQDWKHGFFTRQFYPRSPEDLAAVLDPSAQTYKVKQVHGNRVLLASEIVATMMQRNSEEGLPPADGIASDGVRQAVWVSTADCTPVLIGDIQSGRVAAVHAGWRGTAQKIVPEAIASVLGGGSSLEDLRIAMGPAIGGEVYQVSEQVAAEVGASIIPKAEKQSVEEILQALRELNDSPLLEDPQPGRVRLNVRKVKVFQLEQLGINKEQLAIAPQCTYQQPEYFFSYRRSPEKKIQWSGIVSN